MAFDFKKLAEANTEKPVAEKPAPQDAPTVAPNELDAMLGLTAGKPAPALEASPVATTQPTAPAQKPVAANPLDAMIAASTPSANVEINKLNLDVNDTATNAQANELSPLFNQTSLDAMERPEVLPISEEAKTSPEAVDFLNNVAALQQAIGNPSLIGESIRYIGEELRSKPHLNPILGSHPKHMGLIIQGIRKTYNVALGATVKRRTTKQKKAKDKAVAHKALDDLMGGAGLGDLGSLTSL